jgi:hypothetical protein
MHGSTATHAIKILYCASKDITCIAEVFQATRVVNRIDNDLSMCVFSPTRDLELLDLTGIFRPGNTFLPATTMYRPGGAHERQLHYAEHFLRLLK